MFVSKLRIHSYKSFKDSGEISFKQGINIIIGQNNSGKTALLEALSLQFTNKPHKSLDKHLYAPSSSVELTFTITPAELRNEDNKFRHHSILLPPHAQGRDDQARIAFNEAVSTELNITANIDEHGMSPQDLNYNLYEQGGITKSKNFVQLEASKYGTFDASSRPSYDRELKDLFGWNEIQS